jgi:hypothetical protein
MKPKIQGVKVGRYACVGIEAHERDYPLDSVGRLGREFPSLLWTCMTEDVVLSEKE